MFDEGHGHGHGHGHLRSITPPDDEVDHSSEMDSIAGTLELDPTCEFGVPKRSYSEPPAHAQRMLLANRHHSTATCARGEYETMVHPNAAMYDTQGYVMMRPMEMRAHLQSAQQTSAPIPLQRSLSTSDSPQHHQRLSPSTTEMSSSPRKPALPTISERRQPAREEDRQSDYENYPLPPAMQNASPVYYHPTYENVRLAQEGRRGSQDREQYENVTLTGEQIRTDPRSLQKRGSLRRQHSIKENVVLSQSSGGSTSINGREHRTPSPPKNGLAYPYAEIHHAGPTKDHLNHTVKDVHYSSIDFQSSAQVQRMQQERLDQQMRSVNNA